MSPTELPKKKKRENKICLSTNPVFVRFSFDLIVQPALCCMDE